MAQPSARSDRLLGCVLLEVLNIDSMLHLLTTNLRWLIELLTTTKLLDDASLLILALELLQASFDVLSLFYWYNNHICTGY